MATAPCTKGHLASTHKMPVVVSLLPVVTTKNMSRHYQMPPRLGTKSLPGEPLHCWSRPQYDRIEQGLGLRVAAKPCTPVCLSESHTRARTHSLFRQKAAPSNKLTGSMSGDQGRGSPHEVLLLLESVSPARHCPPQASAPHPQQDCGRPSSLGYQAAIRVPPTSSSKHILVTDTYHSSRADNDHTKGARCEWADLGRRAC